MPLTNPLLQWEPDCFLSKLGLYPIHPVFVRICVYYHKYTYCLCIICVLSPRYYLCIIVYLDVLHSEERIALYLRHICLVFLSISKSAIIHERYAPNTHAIGMQYTDPKYAGRGIAMIPPFRGQQPHSLGPAGPAGGGEGLGGLWDTEL